jgi:hypothetical protein
MPAAATPATARRATLELVGFAGATRIGTGGAPICIGTGGAATEDGKPLQIGRVGAFCTTGEFATGEEGRGTPVKAVATLRRRANIRVT